MGKIYLIDLRDRGKLNLDSALNGAKTVLHILRKVRKKKKSALPDLPREISPGGCIGSFNDLCKKGLDRYV